ALSVPVRLTAIPLTAVVPEDALSVVFTDVAVELALLLKFCVIVPAPEVKVRFLPAAMVVEPFKLTFPVPVEKVLFPDCVILPDAVTSPVNVDAPVTESVPEVDTPDAVTAK